MSIEVLDPTYETGAAAFTPAPRLAALSGAAVGLVSNGKQGTRAFFDAFERELVETHGAARVARVTKANFSAPAEPGIMAEAARWDALVAGVGD